VGNLILVEFSVFLFLILSTYKKTYSFSLVIQRCSMKKKILITTGTRAEYGILRPLLEGIQQSKKLDLLLVVTGTHLSKKYGYTIQEIIKDGFKISKKIPMMPKSDENYSMSVSLGLGIVDFSNCFKSLKPDVNIILGDRDEMLASSLAASHMNIINAHIHGGDVSGGLDEYNRHAITKLSNIHFAATQKSMKRILKMGEDKKYVFFTGSPSIDEVKSKKISSKKELEKKYKMKFFGNEVLLVQHPVTTESNMAEKQIISTLNAINKLDCNTLAISPNSDSGNRKIFKQLEKFSKKQNNFKLFQSLPREDYLGFLKNVQILVGNSSSGLIEASYFNTPVIDIGIRQNNRERGSNVIHMESFSSNQIYQKIMLILKNSKKSSLKKSHIYGNGNASSKIVKILENLVLSDDIIKKQISY
jgi:GDP/UDP-N,N'-diacetylbacillosamine 2-epimerase (hydrolysing)